MQKFIIQLKTFYQTTGFCLLLCILAIASPAMAEEPAALPEWTIAYHVSGGFAGIRQDLTLDSNGELKVINEKNYNIIHRFLRPREVEELGNLLDSLHNVTPADRTNELCRDCIRHELNLTWGGETLKYYYQSGDTVSNELEGVLKYLGQYLQKTP